MNLGGRFNAILLALRNRNYRIYTLGNICSHLGMWAYRIALQWLTWKLTGSAFWLAAIAMADLFPTVILAPLAGAITERVNRIGMMRFSIIFTSLQAGILAYCCFTGIITIEIVFALALSLGIVLAINHPVRLVIVPNMVGRDVLPSAVAINALIFNVARGAGPSIAGGLIVAAGDDAWILGVGLVFIFNCFGNIAFTFALFAIHVKQKIFNSLEAPLNLIPSEIIAGFRYTFAHQGLGAIMIILFIVGICGRTYIDLFSGFVETIFGLGADALGLLVSSVGVGAVLGGFWLAQRGRIEGLTRIVLLNILILGLVLIIFALSQNFYIAVFAVLIGGFSMTVAGTGEHTLIQASVDEKMRGRVVSLYGAISRGGPSLGSLIMGWIADYTGLRLPIAGGAVICILIWLYFYQKRGSLIEALELQSKIKKS